MNKETLGAIDPIKEKKILKDYEANGTNKVVRHALSRHAISDIVYVPDALKDVNLHFSIEAGDMKVANQRQSGRCWIFAGLNILRAIVTKNVDMKHADSFELSQNYISLYDKIEKSNFALENILTLGKRDHDDRELHFILQSPVSDGGQWDMFVNLVKKYGLMPKEAFPETFQSEGTMQSDALVNSYIRSFAAKAHKLLKAGKKEEARRLKEETMEKIYHFFLNCFGVPPKSFDFEYEDKEGKYAVDANLTPKEFFEKYVGNKIDEYQSLINSPTADKPFNKNFTIDYLGNVIEGKPINHLNIEMPRMKELIIKQLSDHEFVWFGSDVSFYRDPNGFTWDDNGFDYGSAFGFVPEFDKADMLDFLGSAMNHAMVITGVNLVNGKPTKWKIQNSWGGDRGKGGYYVFSDSFFDKFVYQAVILKRYLSVDEMKASLEEPTHLHPWDPMGTLAD